MISWFLGVYVERKNVLEALVQPIENRVIEFTKRPAALEKLTATLNKYQKVIKLRIEAFDR